MQRDSQPTLTAGYAAYRSALLDDVRYRIELSLDAGSPEYSGSVVVEFSLSRADTPLTLDFGAGTVYSVEINGEDSIFEYNNALIGLDTERLRRGKNRVVVHYSHPYSRDGAGLQRSRDAQDGQVYLYSHFEPYDANRLFPCFDQPDLKATYRLSVSAPADWEIVSAASATSVTMMSPGVRVWEFAEIQPFSTYLFSLHAGPYSVWEARTGSIPLRLFARPSLAAYIDADYWFELTRNGFAFYEALFDIPYPFVKYDQLIVPDLNIGAMENVAAVTYNERYVTRAAPTAEQRQRHVEVLLHEMAHMWFGNLVTPRWWDGLWLKEAYATYVSHIAMRETTDLDNPAQRFFAGTKQLAYRADEYDTHHPVDVAVDDTHVAFANFDAITYEKGSSVLTQLSHYVGAKIFFEGSRRYLKDHAWGNTTLEDFIGALEKTADIDLQDWMQTWLRCAGVNSLTPELNCDNGVVQGLRLVQRAPGGTPLRSHRLQVAFFDADGENTVFPVSVEGGVTEVAAAAGRPCPVMTLVNHEDWSFVRGQLDPRTLKNFYSGIGGVGDPLARSMLWQSLWEMVRNADYPLPAYVDLVGRHVVAETDNLLLIQLTRSMRASLDFLVRGAAAHGLPASRAADRLAAAAWAGLDAAPAGSERQKTWLEAFIGLASTSEYLQHLEAFLDGHRIPPGLQLDADTRWDILARLNAFAFGEFESRTDMEAIRDKSDRGRRRAIAANASRPDPAVKRAWMNGILNQPDFMPLGQLRWGMRALAPAHQLALLEPFSESLFHSLDRLGRTRDDAFLRELARLIPLTCGEENLAPLEAAVVDSASLHPILARAVRNALADSRRCLAIGKLAATYSA